jgi:IclR family transcriptional regulator, acetate operon repressor
VSDATARSATNVLRLLLMLGERGRLRVTSVAEELRVAPSTAHRLLGALAQAGFAAHDDDRTYIPGPAYVRLRVPPSHPEALVALAGPHLVELAATTGETTHLMVRDGAYARFVHSVEGRALLRVSSRTGAVIPAHLTSGGRALLAQLSDEELQELYADGLPGSPRPQRMTVEELLVELKEVRERGIAENVEQSEPGISAMGIAFRRYHLTAALSLSLPSVRYRTANRTRMEQLLRRTAGRIEAMP